jgi:hypothetical protein
MEAARPHGFQERRLVRFILIGIGEATRKIGRTPRGRLETSGRCEREGRAEAAGDQQVRSCRLPEGTAGGGLGESKERGPISRHHITSRVRPPLGPLRISNAKSLQPALAPAKGQTGPRGSVL